MQSLFDYHQRREEALGYVSASNLLLSLASAIILYANLSFIEANQRTEKAAELLKIIVGNQKKITRLSKKIESSKSINRQRTWYRVVLRLYEEVLNAEYEMKEMNHGR